MCREKISYDYDHTSALWFAIRQLQLTVISLGTKVDMQIDPYEIHPFKSAPPPKVSKRQAEHTAALAAGLQHISTFPIEDRSEARRDLHKRLAAEFAEGNGHG